jgi:hypothetical protein
MSTNETTTLDVEVECIECDALVCIHQQTVIRRLERSMPVLSNEGRKALEDVLIPLIEWDRDAAERDRLTPRMQAADLIAAIERHFGEGVSGGGEH